MKNNTHNPEKDFQLLRTLKPVQLEEPRNLPNLFPFIPESILDTVAPNAYKWGSTSTASELEKLFKDSQFPCPFFERSSKRERAFQDQTAHFPTA